MNDHESPDPLAAGLDEAIGAWADAHELPHTDKTRAEAIRALYCLTRAILEAADPEGMGTMNREFAAAMNAKMDPPSFGAPPGSKGELRLDVCVNDDLVALRYAEDCVVAFPPATARMLASALAACADRIDEGHSFLFMYGPPPGPRPEEGRR
jgi:hypothetical protein